MDISPCLCGHHKNSHTLGLGECRAGNVPCECQRYSPCTAHADALAQAFDKCAEAVARNEAPRCACGHGLFDHEKVYVAQAAEPWRGDGGLFFHFVAGPTFTLSGRCLTCACVQFSRAKAEREDEWKSSAMRFHRALANIEALLGWPVRDAPDGNDRLQRIRAIIRAATF